MNCWLLFGVMLSTSLLAQPVTNAPPAAPILSTPAPAVVGGKTNAPPAKKKKSGKKAEKKAVAKKKEPAVELKTVPLVAGPAVVDANHVNVRGQAKLKSEIVARLNKGQPVTVLEEIIRNNSGPDEPSAWAKILLPTNAHAWVSTSFIEATNHSVRPKKLNLRSGPGENYSIIGRLQQGDAVKELATKDDWTEIEAPANAYAFVAAQYLKQEAPGAPATTPSEPTMPPPTPTTVPEGPTVATTPTEIPTATPPVETPAITNAPPETTPTPAVEEPPPKRIVQREGLVRGLVSIQAPTKFSLISPDNGHTIDYLYTSSPNLDLRRYKGLRIIVTGEEALDERWGNTPVITIQKIQVLDEFAPVDASPGSKH
ncbi:MAG TPA: SH3 domain-containing protein [Candidatus Binatia bacterium]|nr:SH3 domain-containing protein [Candidatus Binatia bacterium]